MRVKKMIMTLSIAAIMLAFTGCQRPVSDNNLPKEDENVVTGTEEKDNIEQGDNGQDNGEKKDDGENDDGKNEKEQGSSGQEDQGILKGDLTKIIEKIYEKKDTGINLFDTPIDLNDMDSVRYNTGLEDISKVKEAVVSEAMISSQAYSMVLLRTNTSADAEEVAKAMLDGINTRKWICVEADDIKIVTHDDLVLLAMVASSMDEVVTSQQLVDAFGEICDTKFEKVLTK